MSATAGSPDHVAIPIATSPGDPGPEGGLVVGAPAPDKKGPPSLFGGSQAPEATPVPKPGVVLAVDPRGGPAGAIPSLSSPMSRLAKLQSYLPTGTWITYTALQTWALSISPNTPPPTSDNPSHQSTCNSDQRVALSVAIALGLLSAFGTPFIKTFVLDSDSQRILFPAPTAVKVLNSIVDRVTGATFPYRQHNGKWLWPVADAKDGGWVRENGGVKVMEFKHGCDMKVDKGPLDVVQEKDHIELVAQDVLDSGRDTLDVGFEIPTPEPSWSWTIRGPNYQYIDFSLQVWLHALVSVLAFAALALFSTQVTGCLFPAIPDYLPGVAQTAILAGVGFFAAYFVNDQSVSFGQATYSPHVLNIPPEDLKEIPLDLQPVVERVFIVQARDTAVHHDKSHTG